VVQAGSNRTRIEATDITILDSNTVTCAADFSTVDVFGPYKVKVKNGFEDTVAPVLLTVSCPAITIDSIEHLDCGPNYQVTVGEAYHGVVVSGTGLLPGHTWLSHLNMTRRL